MTRPKGFGLDGASSSGLTARRQRKAVEAAVEALEGRVLLSAAPHITQCLADNRGQVILTLDAALQPATVNTNSVVIKTAGPDGLLGTADDVKQSATVTYDQSDNQIQLDATLPANQPYMVVVKGAKVLGTNGTALDGNFNGANVPSGDGLPGSNYKFKTSPKATPQACFTTSLGDIDVQLFSAQTPSTVTNFESYANAGAWDGTFFQYSAPGVIAAGGYTVANNLASPVPQDSSAAATEAGIANTLGTMAFGACPGDPDAAGNQWFFNLADNSSRFDAQQGEATVCGNAANAASLATLQQIAALPTVNADATLIQGSSSVLAEMPVMNPKVTSSSLTTADLVYVTRVAMVMKVSALSSKQTGGQSLMAPSSLTATLSGPIDVQLSWTDNDPSATGYDVLRSTDGGPFCQIAALSSSAASSYADDSALSGYSYQYEVQACSTSSTSVFSNVTPAVAVALLAPTSATAQALGDSSVLITWIDNDPAALGYSVSRSTDGTNFTTLPNQVTLASATSYTDSTVQPAHLYYYRVQAYNNNPAAPSAFCTTSAVTIPLPAPTGLQGSATLDSVQLSWDNDASAASYYVLRSTDGKSFSSTAASVCSYTDSAIVSGQTYYYEVEAYNGGYFSPPTAMITVSIGLATPAAPTATAEGPSSVQLSWSDSDATVDGYDVLRSKDGMPFTQIARLVSTPTAPTTSYTDSSVAPDQTYYYEIEVYKGTVTSPASDMTAATTLPQAPSALTATVSGASIYLSWTDNDSHATSYLIQRSTDGTNFSPIAQLTSPTATTDFDTTATVNQPYYYQVQACARNAVSRSSNMVSATLPPGASDVTVASRYTDDEIVVTASGPDDTVSVIQNGATLSIGGDGQQFTEPVTPGGLFVYTRGGSDAISIDASVTAPTTLETIDGALTTITSAGTDVTAWIDSTDGFSGIGMVHRVASLAGGVSKATGASLPDPIDAGRTQPVDLSLWGTGPVISDENQGEVGDCYFLSGLAALALQQPAALQQTAVDMGDGTYVVQFENQSGSPVFVRVSNQLSIGPFNGYLYAYPGPNQTIWAPIIEKAFAYFRMGANSYNSLNGGFLDEPFDDLGIGTPTDVTPSSYTESQLYSLISGELADGQAVTLGTPLDAPDLVSDHAYTLVSVSENASGVTTWEVRNPWGQPGDALENGGGYASLTFAQLTANFDDLCYT